MKKSPSLLPLLIFLGLAVYDVIIGGAIAALLKSDGFTALDQRLNNVHQLAYGMVTAGAMSWCYARARNFLPVLAVAVLFASFVEDTLFYLLIPFFNPLISLITGGVIYEAAGGEWMPGQVAGWTGWVGRMAAGQNMALARSTILLLNGIGIMLAFFLLRRYVCTQGRGHAGGAEKQG